MAVVTPIWRPKLSVVEAESLRCSIASSSLADHWLLAPQSLDLTWYQQVFPTSHILELADDHFTSVHSYSYLMTTPGFYRKFDDYEFITICQTDAVLIKDPSEINASTIDYIGAPWSPPLKYVLLGKRLYVSSSFGEANESTIIRRLGRRLTVGNGGLSLRRTETLIKVTETIHTSLSNRTRRHVLEDALICSVGRKYGLRVASQEQAETVFLESQASGLTSIPDIFGFHGLERWNPELLRIIVERNKN